MHPLRISGATAHGRKRQGRLYTCGGPSRSKGSHAVAAAITSEPSPDALTHSTVHWTNRLQDTRMAIAPYGDRRCSSHLSHHQVKCTRKHNHTASPSPQFAIPQRGRKRLSREAILRTELALEWPELVQIGRFKVQRLPTDIKKQILTSFWKYKIIHTTLPPPGGSFDPETISHYSCIFDGVVALDHLLQLLWVVEVAGRRPRSIIH